MNHPIPSVLSPYQGLQVDHHLIAPQYRRCFLRTHHFYEALGNAESLVGNCEVSLEQIKRHPFLVKCEKAMNDDFNTAVVVAHLNEESRGINSECSSIDSGPGDKKNLAVRIAAFKLAGGLLGLLSSSLKNIKQEIFNLETLFMKCLSHILTIQCL